MSRGKNLEDKQEELWDRVGQRIFKDFCNSAGWTAKIIEKELGTNLSSATKYLAGNKAVGGNERNIQARYPSIDTIRKMDDILNKCSVIANDEYLRSYSAAFHKFFVDIRSLRKKFSGIEDPIQDDALAEIEAAKLQLEAVLKPSPQLIGEFISRLKLQVAAEEEDDDGKRAAEVVKALVALDPNPPTSEKKAYSFGWAPHKALLAIHSLRHTLDKAGQGSSSEREILSRMFEILAILIHGADEIARLRSSLESGASVMVTFPATNLTLVEIIMARLDERRLDLQSVSRQEPNTVSGEHGDKWGDRLRSKFQIVKSAMLSSTSTLDEMEDAFDIEASRMILKLPAGSPADVERAMNHLETRPKYRGTPFFICNYLINPNERNLFEEKIRQMKSKWSWTDDDGKIHGIRFINLLCESKYESGKKEETSFRNRQLWEEALLLGIYDMLPADREIL